MLLICTWASGPQLEHGQCTTHHTPKENLLLLEHSWAVMLIALPIGWGHWSPSHPWRSCYWLILSDLAQITIAAVTLWFERHWHSTALLHLLYSFGHSSVMFPGLCEEMIWMIPLGVSINSHLFLALWTVMVICINCCSLHKRSFSDQRHFDYITIYQNSNRKFHL